MAIIEFADIDKQMRLRTASCIPPVKGFSYMFKLVLFLRSGLCYVRICDKYQKPVKKPKLIASKTDF